MHAFMSYQMTDRAFAATVRDTLAPFDITSFMAHDDLEVSEEWKFRILEELSKADLFIAVLSSNYLASSYCMQGSGIAVFRNIKLIVPFSIDETVSPGFMNNVQSTRVDPKNFNERNIVPVIFRANPGRAIDTMIENVKQSRSFRGAEYNFETLNPFL